MALSLASWSPSSTHRRDLHHIAPRSLAPPWLPPPCACNYNYGYYLAKVNAITWYWILARRPYKIIETTIWLLPVDILQNMIISYIKIYHITFLAIPHHMPCKNKLDASTLFLHVLRGFYGQRIKIASYLRKATTWINKLLINRCGVNKQERSNIFRAYPLTSFNAWTPCRSESTSLPLQICFHYSRRDRHPPAAYANKSHVKRRTSLS